MAHRELLQFNMGSSEEEDRGVKSCGGSYADLFSAQGILRERQKPECDYQVMVGIAFRESGRRGYLVRKRSTCAVTLG